MDPHPYGYLLELTREEAEMKRIKIVAPKKIYMLRTNQEDFWCYVRFRRNDAGAFDDVYDIETRIAGPPFVGKPYLIPSEIEANCPLHSFNGNFCKQEFDLDFPCYEWRDRGKLHRLDGPAVVGAWSFTSNWFLQDAETDEETVKKARDEAIGEDVIHLI